MYGSDGPNTRDPWARVSALHHTSAELGVRVLRLSSATAESCLQRMLRLGSACGEHGLTHLRRLADGTAPEKILTGPVRLAADCGDTWYAEAQNMTQIVSLTQHEMQHWLDRLAGDWASVCGLSVPRRGLG